MNVKTHQICLVHLQRNLVYLTELQPENQWPKDMLNLITDAMKQRREKAWDEIDREGLKKRLDELLDGPLGTDDKEFTGMQKGLSGKKDYIFTFLDNPDVPYDNNALNGQLDRQRRSRKSQDFSVRSFEPKRMQ